MTKLPAIIQFNDFYGTLEVEAKDGRTVILRPGQQAWVLDAKCRKTGLREAPENDPELERSYLDGGCIYELQLLGGEFAGAEITYADSANDWDTPAAIIEEEEWDAVAHAVNAKLRQTPDEVIQHMFPGSAYVLRGDWAIIDDTTVEGNAACFLSDTVIMHLVTGRWQGGSVPYPQTVERWDNDPRQADLEFGEMILKQGSS